MVLRQRTCETLPLPMCVANLLVSSQWALYGVLVSDIYIIVSFFEFFLFFFGISQLNSKDVLKKCHKIDIVLKKHYLKKNIRTKYRKTELFINFGEIIKPGKSTYYQFLVNMNSSRKSRKIFFSSNRYLFFG